MRSNARTTHEPQNAFVEFQWFMHFRFMAPTHVRIGEVFAFHELGWGETPSNPDCSVGPYSRARRSLAPPLDGFMAPTHVRFLEVSALHEPWLFAWGARPSRLHRSASRRLETTWGTATRVRRDAAPWSLDIVTASVSRREIRESARQFTAGFESTMAEVPHGRLNSSHERVHEAFTDQSGLA